MVSPFQSFEANPHKATTGFFNITYLYGCAFTCSEATKAKNRKKRCVALTQVTTSIGP
jgi:hypothetical protein